MDGVKITSVECVFGMHEAIGSRPSTNKTTQLMKLLTPTPSLHIDIECIFSAGLELRIYNSQGECPTTKLHPHLLMSGNVKITEFPSQRKGEEGVSIILRTTES